MLLQSYFGTGFKRFSHLSASLSNQDKTFDTGAIGSRHQNLKFLLKVCFSLNVQFRLRIKKKNNGKGTRLFFSQQALFFTEN